MATNGNTGLIAFTSIDTFPLSQPVVGTISGTTTYTAIVGVGTAFTAIGYTGKDLTIKEQRPLGYLFDASHSEWRQIISIESDTLLYIDKPFSNALTGATIRWIPQSRVRSLAFTDIGNSGVVDGVSLASNEGGGWEIRNFGDPPITPHIFTNCNVTYSYT